MILSLVGTIIRMITLNMESLNSHIISPLIGEIVEIKKSKHNKQNKNSKSSNVNLTPILPSITCCICFKPSNTFTDGAH